MNFKNSLTQFCRSHILRKTNSSGCVKPYKPSSSSFLFLKVLLWPNVSFKKFSTPRAKSERNRHVVSELVPFIEAGRKLVNRQFRFGFKESDLFVSTTSLKVSSFETKFVLYSRCVVDHKMLIESNETNMKCHNSQVLTFNSTSKSAQDSSQ